MSFSDKYTVAKGHITYLTHLFNQDMLLLGTSSGMIYSFNILSKDLSEFAELSQNKITQICYLQNDRNIIISANNKIFNYDLTTKAIVEVNFNNFITDYECIDKQNTNILLNYKRDGNFVIVSSQDNFFLLDITENIIKHKLDFTQKDCCGLFYSKSFDLIIAYSRTENSIITYDETKKNLFSIIKLNDKIFFVDLIKVQFIETLLIITHSTDKDSSKIFLYDFETKKLNSKSTFEKIILHAEYLNDNRSLLLSDDTSSFLYCMNTSVLKELHFTDMKERKAFYLNDGKSIVFTDNSKEFGFWQVEIRD